MYSSLNMEGIYSTKLFEESIISGCKVSDSPHGQQITESNKKNSEILNAFLNL